jgi:hypothetical protein
MGRCMTDMQGPVAWGPSGSSRGMQEREERGSVAMGR